MCRSSTDTTSPIVNRTWVVTFGVALAPETVTHQSAGAARRDQPRRRWCR